mgnify:CR=1 FL=1
MYKIDSFNRDFAISRYVEDIVGRLDFMQVRDLLKHYLLIDKNKLSNEQLENEIQRHDPSLLSDIYIQESMEEVAHA